MTPQVRGALLMVAATLSFSGMGALVKATGVSIPFMELVFFRGVVALPVLWMLARHANVSLAGRHRGLLLARGLSGTVALMLFFFAVTRIPVAEAMLLNQATPVFILPLAVWFLGERVTVRHALLAFTALAGAALVIRPALGTPDVPGLLALGSAFFAAVAYILVRHLSSRESPHTIVFWFAWISTAASAPFLVPAFVVPSPIEAAAMVAMGLLALSGQLLLTVAYRYGEAGRLAVLGSLGAVFGSGWDLLFWKHVPDGWTALGGITVIAACSGIQLLRRSPAPTRPA